MELETNIPATTTVDKKVVERETNKQVQVCTQNRNLLLLSKM